MRKLLFKFYQILAVCFLVLSASTVFWEIFDQTIQQKVILIVESLAGTDSAAIFFFETPDYTFQEFHRVDRPLIKGRQSISFSIPQDLIRLRFDPVNAGPFSVKIKSLCIIDGITSSCFDPADLQAAGIETVPNGSAVFAQDGIQFEGNADDPQFYFHIPKSFKILSQLGRALLSLAAGVLALILVRFALKK